MRQSISSYLVGESEIQGCKEDILKQLTTIKQKIDLIEKGQQEHKEQQIQIFVNKFKKDLKLILRSFQTFQKVLDKLGKEVYEKHVLSKQILINAIRQQMKRFHNIIPSHVQQQIKSSKIRKAGEVSQIEEGHKQPSKIQQCQSIESKDEKQKENESQQQFQQLMMSITNFLAKNEQQQQKQYDALDEWTTENTHVSSQMKSLRREQLAVSIQEMEERKRYKQYIRQQKVRESRTPAKIAGKVVLCLLITALLFIILACVIVYRVVKAIAGQL